MRCHKLASFSQNQHCWKFMLAPKYDPGTSNGRAKWWLKFFRLDCLFFLFFLASVDEDKVQRGAQKCEDKVLNKAESEKETDDNGSWSCGDDCWRNLKVSVFTGLSGTGSFSVAIIHLNLKKRLCVCLAKYDLINVCKKYF